MKNFLPTICCLLMSVFYSCDNSNKHTITAEIKGLGNDTLLIQHYPFDIENDEDERIVYDTIIAQNDKFCYDLQINENTYFDITPKKLFKYRADGSPYMANTRFIFLVLEPNKKSLRITGQIEGTDYLSYNVEPKSFSADWANDRENYKAEAIKSDSMEMAMDYYMDSIRKLNLPKETYNALSQAIFDKAIKIRQLAKVRQLSYIKNNLDKDLAAYYLLRQPYDTVGVYYPQLAESVKKGLFAEDLKKELQKYEEYKLYLQAKEQIKEGADAPDFTLLNLAGESVSLSSLKGKYIVLDFWGSWCGWCIKGFPEMKKYYNKYKNKVEFVGIACRDNDKNWRKAVETNGLNWIQLKEDDSHDVTKKVSVRYAVDGYPTKIILDKDLKFIAVFSGESEEFYQKLDELLQ